MTPGSHPTTDTIDPSAADAVSANDAFDLGTQFDQRGDLPAAEDAYRTADELGHAAAAMRLGVLLEERDDLAGAEQAFRRADERGDATGAFHLAWLLQENDDPAGAEQAYRRAELRGHPAAGANLRILRATAPVPEPAVSEPAVSGPAIAESATAPESATREPARSSAPEARALAPIDAYAAIAADAPAARSLEDSATATAAAEAMAVDAMADEVGLSPDLIAQLNRTGRESRRGRSTPPARRAPSRGGARATPAPRSGRAAPAPRGRDEQHASGKLSRKERRAQRRSAESSGGLPRVVSWLLPILAFGVAFVAGAETKAPTHTPLRLAPAASVTDGGATIATVTPLPAPANLVKAPLHKPAKTPTSTTTGTDLRVAPVYRVPVTTRVPQPTPDQGPTTTSPAQDGAAAATTPTEGTRTTTTTAGSGGTPVVTTSSANGTGTSTGSG